jgi:hypothetical protein
MVFAGTRANQRRGIFSSAYQYVRLFGSSTCDSVGRKESTTASGGRSFRCCRKIWTDGAGRFLENSRSRRPPDSTSGQRERRRNFRSSSGWSSGLSGPPASRHCNYSPLATSPMATATENNKYCFGGKGLIDRWTAHATGNATRLIGHFVWPTLITILFGMTFRWMG